MEDEDKAIHIAGIISRYLLHQASECDMQELDAWLSESKHNQILFDRISHEPNRQDSLYNISAKKDKKLAYYIFEKRVESIQPKRTTFNRWYAVAAAIVVLVSAFCWYMFELTSMPSIDEIHAAGNKGYIELDNGEIFDLDTHQSRVYLSENGLHYTSDTNANILKNNDSRTAKMVTPKGGFYDLVLADGTVVKLNAGSSIRYPITFGKNSRIVYLEGEAYFDVKRDTTRPFIVKTKNQDIRVLGTKFNVNTLAKDEAMTVTVAEGSVQVNASADVGPSSVPLGNIVLKPGQQATSLSGGDMQIKKIDLDQELAWVDGRFDFTGKDFKQIVDELEKWYDIEISYKELPDTKFYGGVYRSANLKTVMNIFEANNISYSYNSRERKIIINP